MATLDEAAYNVLNIVRGGRSSNNEYLSLPQIKYTIKYYRALFARRAVDKGDAVRDFEQDLGLVPTVPVDLTEGIGIKRNWLLRTVPRLPEPVRIRTRHHSGITFVGKPDSHKALPFISRSHAEWQGNDKYTASRVKSYYHEDHIYLVGNTGIDQDAAFVPLAPNEYSHIRIRGIFEDPEAAYNFNAAHSTPWDDGTTEFPCPLDVIQSIATSLLQGEIKMMSNEPTDDVLDNLPNETGPKAG